MIVELGESGWKMILNILGEELERVVSKKEGTGDTGEMYDLTESEQNLVRSIKRISEQVGEVEWSRRGDE